MSVIFSIMLCYLVPPRLVCLFLLESSTHSMPSMGEARTGIYGEGRILGRSSAEVPEVSALSLIKFQMP